MLKREFLNWTTIKILRVEKNATTIRAARVWHPDEYQKKPVGFIWYTHLKTAKNPPKFNPILVPCSTNNEIFYYTKVFATNKPTKVHIFAYSMIVFWGASKNSEELNNKLFIYGLGCISF